MPGDDEVMGEKWSPSLRGPVVITMIKNVIMSPNPDSPANLRAGSLFRK